MRLTVLDKGYAGLINHMGSDLSVVNAARASFARESAELDERGIRLIHYLARNGHSSPFRHQFLSFEIKAPLFVARQWWRYAVGSAHLEDAPGCSELSRRYANKDPEFYLPGNAGWRSASVDKKQGSGTLLSADDGEEHNDALRGIIHDAVREYKLALKDGVCPEQARLLLPAYAMYTTWRWSASLQAVCHFLNERLADDAQVEIQEYARAIHSLAEPLFPQSVAALVKTPV